MVNMGATPDKKEIQMTFLTPSDVRIVSDFGSNAIRINTSDASYDLARRVLMAIKDQTGLNIRCSSENNAAVLLSRPYRDGSVAIKTDVAIPRTADNEFTVFCSYSNIKGKESLNDLAEELKQRIESYELTCRVFPC